MLSVCQQIWKTQQWPKDWKRSVFIPIPKKGNAKQHSNYRTIALISHASKVMLKIFQARLQQYMNWEFLDVQAGFRKSRRTRDQTANICCIIEKAKRIPKTTTTTITTTKHLLLLSHFTVWITTNGKVLQEMGLPDHLTRLLRNVYVCQEATGRTKHGTMDWSWLYIITLLI